MRKTRAQNDQFWGQIDYDMDEYMKKEDIKLFRSPSKGGTIVLGAQPIGSPKLDDDLVGDLAGDKEDKDAATGSKKTKRQSSILPTAEV